MIKDQPSIEALLDLYYPGERPTLTDIELRWLDEVHCTLSWSELLPDGRWRLAAKFGREPLCLLSADHVPLHTQL